MNWGASYFFFRFCGFCLVCATLVHCRSISQIQTDKRPNILLISIDDLRPDFLDPKTVVVSPNLKELAEQGLVFNRIYAQEPTCAPSRASVMSGLRPQTSGVTDLFSPLRSKVPDVLTMPQHFRNNGYTTRSLGKVYHHPWADDTLGWSVREWRAPLANLRGYISPDNIDRINRWGNSSFYERLDVPDSSYEDGKTAIKAIKTLQELKKGKNPFFLALGFFKPHLPFQAPEKYWQIYKEQDIRVPEPYEHPRDRHPASYNFGAEVLSYLDYKRSNEYMGYEDTIVGKIDSVAKMDVPTGKLLTHGYYASLSYSDSQLGLVLDELERLQLRENTIIVLWSDHGFMLGELGDWSKHGLFETELRSTLIISPPGYKKSETNQISELLDIYPTLCELAGINTPPHVEGKSLVPLLKNTSPVREDVAFSQYGRDYFRKKGPMEKHLFLGYSVRSERFRYTEYRLKDNLNTPYEIQLYDQDEKGELVNLAKDPKYDSVVQQHQKILTRKFTILGGK